LRSTRQARLRAIPLGTPAMLLVLALVLRRAADETGMLSRWNLAAQPIK
jgi:hypothetical protein